ncbi:S-adenosyl-L-methionine-dependent methyltransferase [Daldinia decipiens]|uniref:S-adenosyl-L-methionine-dependent methyltransferase n=1 Tax=Daldinia decipiens TaxID=326647 RepID=UPI0020C4CDCE|nr:S-adenosyl-L-methionine-dependent methyltransferase [Daldinia decipiens]KAI1655266.1 S-adenosyl-L-methionine-dependent methyltransferase [Daldinia decipiens]
MSDVYTDNMTRNDSEVQRLDTQLDYINDNIGYLLHPAVVASLPPKPQIADIGTGTGKFLLLLREQNPDAILDGYDISPKLYPQESTLPPNISLSVLDMKQPAPKELHGKYDVVHARLLVAAMLPTDWAIVVRNLTELLKPGGFLQWEECDFLGVKYLRGLVDSKVEAIRFMGNLFSDALRERSEHGWCTLPREMRDAGLNPVLTDVTASDRLPETRKTLTTNVTGLFFSWARMMTERGAPGAMTNDRLDEMEKKTSEDVESGGYVRYEIYVACGRKPWELSGALRGVHLLGL